uniref:Uncharacterized protein n=1 Tax=Physcomitrium patens TaxID=3218 RepID=A0A2K1ITE5_PHYPA|nr:hypothetical protein PHYPA_024487 [Physcomitrium patens]
MILFRGGLTLPLSLSFSLSGSLWLHFLWCVPLGVWLEFAVGFFALSFCLLSIAKKGVCVLTWGWNEGRGTSSSCEVGPSFRMMAFCCLVCAWTGWHDVVVYRRGTSEGEEGPSLAKLRCVGLCDVGDPFFCGCRRDFAHPNLSRCCGLEKLWKSCLGKIREFVFEVTLFDRSRIHCTRPPEFAPGTPDQPKRVGGPWFNEGYSIC